MEFVPLLLGIFHVVAVEDQSLSVQDQVRPVCLFFHLGRSFSEELLNHAIQVSVELLEKPQIPVVLFESHTCESA